MKVLYNLKKQGGGGGGGAGFDLQPSQDGEKDKKRNKSEKEKIVPRAGFEPTTLRLQVLLKYPAHKIFFKGT